MSKHGRAPTGKRWKLKGSIINWTAHFLKSNAIQHLPSFFVQSFENLDQGAFPVQRIEATHIGRDDRGKTGNFVLIKLGQ